MSTLGITVQKPSNSVCYTASSEPFRIYMSTLVGFEVLVVVTMKSTLYWVCNTMWFETARRFGGTYGLYLQGLIVNQARNQQKQVALKIVAIRSSEMLHCKLDGII
jgi:hypothetical protein